ncbi:reticulon-1-like isoform X2 [Lucilia sericata]|uniref:reticulon-1-like isoform X2 n=1 Tax=Lucilia sericata TaxID=13632 RepID=UPI0018A84707|nr:reticulon-1-like isoform X2 [Lucilia sericata]
MDFNFTDLKKEAAATADDIFSHSSEAAKQVGQDLLGNLGGGGGRQDDNSHTEQSFGNDQKEMDFEHVDPQTFVQRMSAGAKEAQEQLDAKFSQSKDELEDFFGQTSNAAKQGVAAATNDFMNAERGFMNAAGDKAKDIEKKAAQAVDDLFGSHLGSGDSKFEASAPLADNVQSANNNFNNFMDDNAPMTTFGKTSTAAAAVSKDSDNDSPSISYNPSPVKKIPATDALKEQDNEKFISSEDLLGDFKEERTATPDSQASAKLPTQMKAAVTNLPTTDLDVEDDDEDFVQAEIPTKPVEQKTAAAPIQEPTPVPVAKPAPIVPEPVKTQPPPSPATQAPVVPETKTETPTPVVVDTKPKTSSTVTTTKTSTNAQQPNIVSVEDIFYKYGLVESLIYWRDVKKSGIVFGAGLVTLLAISCFSVISVFAYLSLILLTGTIAFRIYKSVMQAIQKTSDGHPFKEYLEIDLTLSQEKIQNIAGVAVAHVNGFTAELRRLFLVEDLVDSIKFGVIMWVMTYIGAWFNGMTLVILAFVSLFTLPKVYENNKQSIDTYLDLARSKVAEVTEKIKVAIPIGNKKPIAAETDKDK